MPDPWAGLDGRLAGALGPAGVRRPPSEADLASARGSFLAALDRRRHRRIAAAALVVVVALCSVGVVVPVVVGGSSHNVTGVAAPAAGSSSAPATCEVGDRSFACGSPTGAQPQTVPSASYSRAGPTGAVHLHVGQTLHVELAAGAAWGAPEIVSPAGASPVVVLRPEGPRRFTVVADTPGATEIEVTPCEADSCPTSAATVTLRIVVDAQ